MHEGVPIQQRDLASLLAMQRLVDVMLDGFVAADAHADHAEMVRLLGAVADRLETERARREQMARAAMPHAPSLRVLVVDGVPMPPSGWSPS